MAKAKFNVVRLRGKLGNYVFVNSPTYGAMLFFYALIMEGRERNYVLPAPKYKRMMLVKGWEE